MSPPSPPSRALDWADLTAPELADLVTRDPVAVLPLAAVEQHGPHLPLSTDLVIARGILDRARRALAPDLPVLILPEQPMGASLEHAAYAGTLTVSADTLQRFILETAGSLARAGVKRLVLFNTHGGNKHVVDEAGLRARADHGLLVVKAHSFRLPRPAGVDLPEREWTHGLHGGAVETAMMLHLAPDSVRAEHVDRFTSLGEDLEDRLSLVRPEGSVSFSWLAHDLNPHGVTGDARLATAEMGRLLVEGYGASLATTIGDTRTFPLDRLRPAP